ncbi:MAG TPA: hypothetical protein DD706_14820 [Nitrospiraceae bacterium]|nr:hypothetical protein [Nitrospiraceae bacterium]
MFISIRVGFLGQVASRLEFLSVLIFEWRPQWNFFQRCQRGLKEISQTKCFLTGSCIPIRRYRVEEIGRTQ